MKNLDLNELLSNFKATNQLLLSIAENHNILNAIINDDECILQDIIDNNNSLINCFKNYQLNDGWIDVNSNLPEPIDTQKQLRNQHNKHQVFYIDEYGNKSVDYAWYVLADIDTQIMPIWELCSDISTIITPMYWQPISMPDVE